MPELYSRDLRALLDGIAASTAAPGAGAVAGIVTAMAAGLIASAARRSPDWAEARGVSAQAQALQSRVEMLAEANEQAYLDALALLDGRARGRENRDTAIGKALDTAAELPLAIAEAAFDVATLGAEAAEHAAPAARRMRRPRRCSPRPLHAPPPASWPPISSRAPATSASSTPNGSLPPRRTLPSAPSRQQHRPRSWAALAVEGWAGGPERDHPAPQRELPVRPLVRRLADECGEPGALRLTEQVCLAVTGEVISQVWMHLGPPALRRH